MKDKILKSLLTNIVLINMLPLNAFAVNNVDLTYEVPETEGSAIFHLDTSAMNFTNDTLTKDINYHITVTGGNYYANNTDVKASPYLIEATESELIGEHNKNNKISVNFDYTNSKEIIDLTKDATEENTPYRGSLQASIAKVEKADSYVGKTTILFSEGSNIADGDYTEGPFTYSIKNNEATMTWYNANEGGTDVIIPRKTNLGAPVTAIGDYAFAYSGDKLTSVEIPNSVTSIGASAFNNNSLTSVTIPNSVTSIGEYAFAENSLTSVEISNSVTSIEREVFANNSLKSVTIPNGVTSIGLDAFAFNDLISVEIPNSVTSIGDGAFAHNSLTSIEISNSVTSIGTCAFAYNDLTSVEIPNSVTSLASEAFDSDVTILFNGSLNIADGNYTEGPFTYSITNNEATVTGYNASIGGTDVIIPRKTNSGAPVTKIEKNTFKYKELTSVEIPDSVTSIGDYAFTVNHLTSVKISNSVTSIGDSAFSINSLTSIVIPNSVTYIGNHAFSNNNSTPTSVVIPNSVTYIGDYAFYNDNLTSVEIPSSVTSIGEYAFANNNDLTSVVIPNSVTTLASNAFDIDVTITRK